jgi:probable HAF family extracellular repeat protein
MTPLPTVGGTNGQALGINNRGEIVGQAEGPNTDPCSPFALEVSAVIWRDGHIQQVLPPFAGSAAVASAINDKGNAIGLSGCATTTFYAVLWRHGKPFNLGSLGGVFGNIPSFINNRNQVVGQSDLPGDTVHHAFLWENGVIADLGSLSAALPNSVANGINNYGQVVGFSQDENGDEPSSVAWVWQNGVMTDLNELIADTSPLFLMEALSVNDHGDIAGFGRLSNGEHRGFVLRPCNDGDEGCKNSSAGTATARTANRRPPDVSANSISQRRWTRWYRWFVPSH